MIASRMGLVAARTARLVSSVRGIPSNGARAFFISSTQKARSSVSVTLDFLEAKGDSDSNRILDRGALANDRLDLTPQLSKGLSAMTAAEHSGLEHAKAGRAVRHPATIASRLRAVEPFLGIGRRLLIEPIDELFGASVDHDLARALWDFW